MTDITDLDSPWWPILQSYRRGTLQKAAVVTLLKTGITPPPEALPMLADVIGGDCRLQEGRPAKYGRQMQHLALFMVGEIQRIIENPDADDSDMPEHVIRDFEAARRCTTYCNRPRKTARQQAQEWVAEVFGVKVRSIQAWQTEFRKND